MFFFCFSVPGGFRPPVILLGMHTLWWKEDICCYLLKLSVKAKVVQKVIRRLSRKPTTQVCSALPLITPDVVLKVWMLLSGHIFVKFWSICFHQCICLLRWVYVSLFLSELVKDLQCYSRSAEQAHCVWLPGSPAPDLKFYYEYVGFFVLFFNKRTLGSNAVDPKLSQSNFSALKLTITQCM